MGTQCIAHYVEHCTFVAMSRASREDHSISAFFNFAAENPSVVQEIACTLLPLHT